MPRNKYFNFYPPDKTPEHLLVEDVLKEVIQINGTDVWYIPRESVNTVDLIFGEDPTSKFSKAYTMEMYLNTGNSFGGQFDGQHDLVTKFGLDIADDVKLIVSRRVFSKIIPSSLRIRPREGDLIYVSLFPKLLEIKWVEKDKPMFYTLGNKSPYVYELTCESFRYSNETIDTGVEEIDSVQDNNAYTIKIQLEPGLRDYYLGETVFQGNSYAIATITAQVSGWEPANNVIYLTNILGEFLENQTLTGLSSNAIHSIAQVSDRGNFTPYDLNNNLDLQSSANNIIDQTENNPFGKI